MEDTHRKVIVARRIREVRGSEPREAFAGRLGYHRLSSGAQQIWRWETGRNLPSQNGAFLLAKLTGKSVGFFLGEDDPEEEASLMVALHGFLTSQIALRHAPAVEPVA